MNQNANDQNKKSADVLQDEVSALKADLSKVQTDIQSIAQSLMGMGKDSAKEYRDLASQRMESGLDAVEKYIEQRPVTTVLAAFVVGMLAGKLFGGK